MTNIVDLNKNRPSSLEEARAKGIDPLLMSWRLPRSSVGYFVKRGGAEPWDQLHPVPEAVMQEIREMRDVLAYWLAPATREDLIPFIAKLFLGRAMRSEPNPAVLDARMELYVDALRRFPTTIVGDVVDDIVLKGVLPGPWLPEPGEVAQLCSKSPLLAEMRQALVDYDKALAAEPVKTPDRRLVKREEPDVD